jgi:hypothetical protein
MAYFSTSREPRQSGRFPAAGTSLYSRALSVLFLLIGALSLTASGNQPRRRHAVWTIARHACNGICDGVLGLDGPQSAARGRAFEWDFSPIRTRIRCVSTVPFAIKLAFPFGVRKMEYSIAVIDLCRFIKVIGCDRDCGESSRECRRKPMG